MIAIFLCFIWKMLLSGTLEVMSWWPAQVSDMNVPCGFCVEEGGDPVVSTLSKFCWANLALLLNLLLPYPPYQRPRVFPPCGLSFVEMSMCLGLFMVHYLIL